MSHHLTALPSHGPSDSHEGLISIPWLTVTVNSKKGIISNPPRCNILFRKWFNKFVFPKLQGRFADRKGPPQKLISKFAMRMWLRLPKIHRDFWKKVAKDVKAYHMKLYPSFHSQDNGSKKKQKGNAKPSGPGPKRSPRGAVRSSPYFSQRAGSLPSSTIHPSTSLPISGPSIPADIFPTSIPAYHPVAHPTMYAPPPSSSMVGSSSFAVPPSFYPPSTLPFTAPSPSSFFAPPPSWSLPQQHAPSFSMPALPFPLTSAPPTTAFTPPLAAFPAQAQYQAPLGGYIPIQPPPNPQLEGPDFPFDFFDGFQADALGMHSLPADNLFATQQFMSDPFGIDLSDPLLHLPNF